MDVEGVFEPLFHISMPPVRLASEGHGSVLGKRPVGGVLTEVIGFYRHDRRFGIISPGQLPM